MGRCTPGERGAKLCGGCQAALQRRIVRSGDGSGGPCGHVAQDDRDWAGPVARTQKAMRRAAATAKASGVHYSTPQCSKRRAALQQPCPCRNCRLGPHLSQPAGLTLHHKKATQKSTAAEFQSPVSAWTKVPVSAAAEAGMHPPTAGAGTVRRAPGPAQLVGRAPRPVQHRQRVACIHSMLPPNQYPFPLRRQVDTFSNSARAPTWAAFRGLPS